jgi:sugar (pentulose or hexulose) kinase
VGGGAREDRVKQLAADILGITIQSPDLYDASARGAALMASVGAGWFDSIKEASSELARPLSLFHPDPGAVAIHNQRFERFRELLASNHGESR